MWLSQPLSLSLCCVFLELLQHVRFHSNHHLMHRYYFYLFPHRWGNRGTGRLNLLSKVTQKSSKESGFQPSWPAVSLCAVSSLPTVGQLQGRVRSHCPVQRTSLEQHTERCAPLVREGCYIWLLVRDCPRRLPGRSGIHQDFGEWAHFIGRS